MWQSILEALFQVLKVFYSFTKDWGLAIVLMTIAFRILIWPLMNKQIKSTVGMQKLQPLMKEIQEKYADDKQKQSEEMMKLYKEQEVSPLSGCLPMLLQMPLLFAFYGMLSIAHADKAGKLVGGGPLYRFLDGQAAPFLKVLPDIMKTPTMILEAHGGWNHIGAALPTLWPYLIILVLFAVGSLIPMLMTPGGGNQQKTMGIVMSVFMLYIGFIIPAGALLYYATGTFFMVGQQALIQRQIKLAEEKEVAEIIAAEDETPKKGKQNKSKAALPDFDTESKANTGSGKGKAKSNKGTGAKSGPKK